MRLKDRVIFAIIVAFAMITFILPIFDSMYKELGPPLPFLKQALINLSHAFKNIFFYVIFIPVIVLIVLGFRAIKRNPKSRLVYDTIKVRIPLIGGVLRKIAISRFARMFSALLSSGVQIIRALDISRRYRCSTADCNVPADGTGSAADIV